MSLLMVPFKVDKDYLKLKGDPEGLILTLTWVFHCDGRFSRCFVVCCRRFMSEECFKRKKKAMPWSEGVFAVLQ